MKSETYFKVLLKWLSKSICFVLFSKEIRLIWLYCQLSLSFPWTLDHYQQNSVEDSQIYLIPARLVPIWKQTMEWPIQESLAVRHQQDSRKVTMLQALCFYKAAFCAVTCWSTNHHVNRCGCMKWIMSLLVIHWQQPGHQGTLRLCSLIGVTLWGNPFLFPALHIDTFGEP